SLRIVGGASGSSVAYSSTQRVGALGAPLEFTAPQDNDAVTVHLNDLLYPSQLAALQGVWTQDGTVVQAITAAGDYSANLGAGKAQLFLSASPDTTTGRGVYAATVTDGSGVLLDSVRTVVDASHVGFVFTPPQALTAGAYQLTVTDFQKPAPLAGLGGGIAVQ